jgi:hypothetical protein
VVRSVALERLPHDLVELAVPEGSLPEKCGSHCLDLRPYPRAVKKILRLNSERLDVSEGMARRTAEILSEPESSLVVGMRPEVTAWCEAALCRVPGEKHSDLAFHPEPVRGPGIGVGAAPFEHTGRVDPPIEASPGTMVAERTETLCPVGDDRVPGLVIGRLLVRVSALASWRIRAHPSVSGVRGAPD